MPTNKLTALQTPLPDLSRAAGVSFAKTPEELEAERLKKAEDEVFAARLQALKAEAAAKAQVSVVGALASEVREATDPFAFTLRWGRLLDL